MMDIHDEKFKIVRRMIVNSRKKSDKFVYEDFINFVNNNLRHLCLVLDTRWLISILDTIADHDETEIGLKAMIPLTYIKTLNITYVYDIDGAFKDKRIYKKHCSKKRKI